MNLRLLGPKACELKFAPRLTFEFFSNGVRRGEKDLRNLKEFCAG